MSRQEVHSIFINAKEEDIKNFFPEELEILNRLYGVIFNRHLSQPNINSFSADNKISRTVIYRRHKHALQKLMHTTKDIYVVNRPLIPTSELVEFMRQKSPPQGTNILARQWGISPDIVHRWERQEGIQLKRMVWRPISPSAKVLDYIKTNYPNKSAHALGTETGYSETTIIKWLRDLGVTVSKNGRKK